MTHFLLAKYKQYSLVTMKTLLIYPFGRLFFVHKTNTTLRDDIYKGLLAAFEKENF